MWEVTMSSFQLERVQWTELVPGDVVSINGRFEELLGITPSNKGKALTFGSGHTEINYDIRDENREVYHYDRVLKSKEGGQQVPELQLGFLPITKGSDEEKLTRYRNRRKRLLAEIEDTECCHEQM